MDTKKENKKIVNKMNKVYTSSCRKFGISSKSVLWDDVQTQHFRFFELLTHLDLNSNNKSILDLGCGNGELYRLLNSMGFRGKYTGFDINRNLLIQARRRFKDINVRQVDILKDNVSKRFDYVVISGLFNVNVGQSREWVFAFIKKAFSICIEALAFNMISSHVTFNEKEMFYCDPAEILSFCLKQLSPRVTLVHHNLPFNFTATVFKNTLWDSVNAE